jgi:DNA-binding response OmpR family regulator
MHRLRHLRGLDRRELCVDTVLPPVRVLVADDEPDIRDLVCLAVRKAALTEVTAVADGTSALAAARLSPPDLAVLDVSMPGATGLEVCAALRSDPATAGIRILLLSAGASLEDVARGLAAGADAYLAKPFAVAGLVHQVRALTERQPA